MCQYGFQNPLLTPLGQAACAYTPDGTFLEARIAANSPALAPQLIPFLTPVPCPGEIMLVF